MKTKAIVILILLTAVVTLSFTFSSANKKAEVKESTTLQAQSEPAGGLGSQDKL